MIRSAQQLRQVVYSATSPLFRLASSRELSTQNGPSWDYDLIINGGSIVGASLVAHLVKELNNSLKICIIDPKPSPKYDECINIASPDIRVYALSPATIIQLKKIGAWHLIEKRTQPYSSMQVWETVGPGVVSFSASDAKDVNCTELGRIAEDRTILSAIHKTIADHNTNGNVHYIYGPTITSIDVDRQPGMPHSFGPAKIVLVDPKDKSEQHLTARLVVGADGNTSIVRKLSNLTSYGWSYNQEAIVATLKVDPQLGLEASSTAYQRYLPTGPLAVLPLWGGYCSIVWSLPVSQAKKLLSLTNEDFLARVNEALTSPSRTDRWSILDDNDGVINSKLIRNLPPILKGTINHAKRELASIADTFMASALLSNANSIPRAPRLVEVCSPRVSFPLNFSNCDPYVSNRVALIGDAAHTIHPQAGQGLNLGIADARDLADLIVQGLSTGADIGNASLLKAYHDKRYMANLSMMLTVDVINRVFSESNKHSSLADAHMVDQSKFIDGSTLDKYRHFLRSFGMLGIHSNPLLKAQIARFAMGV